MASKTESPFAGFAGFKFNFRGAHIRLWFQGDQFSARKVGPPNEAKFCPIIFGIFAAADIKFWTPQVAQSRVLSLKLTASLHVKMDGWKTILEGMAQPGQVRKCLRDRNLKPFLLDLQQEVASDSSFFRVAVFKRRFVVLQGFHMKKVSFIFHDAKLQGNNFSTSP